MKLYTIGSINFGFCPYLDELLLRPCFEAKYPKAAVGEYYSIAGFATKKLAFRFFMDWIENWRVRGGDFIKLDEENYDITYFYITGYYKIGEVEIDDTESFIYVQANGHMKIHKGYPENIYT